MKVDIRNRALRYLARREHSRMELARKLAGSAEAGEIEALLDDLEAKDLLSNQRFAAATVRHRGDDYGDAYLKNTLMEKGVKELDAALTEVADEESRLRALLLKPAWQALGKPRAVQRLLRRGFNADNVYRVLRQLEREGEWHGDMGDW